MYKKSYSIVMIYGSANHDAYQKFAVALFVRLMSFITSSMNYTQ